MFDLLDTLTGTTKPDYRSAATLAYRMSKPASYYERQVKVRKARPGQFPSKDLGPKALPDVDAFVAGVKLTPYKQVFSCGWHLGEAVVAAYGAASYGNNGAKTLEDCARLAHEAITERRANIRPAVEKVAKAPKFVTGAVFATMDGMAGEDRKGSYSCMAKVGESFVAHTSMAVPMDCDAVYAWRDMCWVITRMDKEVIANYEMGAPIAFQIIKGATHYGIKDGLPCAWKQDKDGESVKLWEGEPVAVAHTWIAKAEVLFTQWGGKAPKLPTIEISPARGSSLRGGVCNGWLVMPVNPKFTEF